jgi:hypothetical protein
MIMRLRKLFILIFTVILFGCEDPESVDITDPGLELDSKGILDIYFIYNIQGIPKDRVKRADLSLAYTADSMYRGEFFRATNVSDVISKYRFYLPPGVYYYHATLLCLAGGDSCRYSEFGEQFGLRMDGGKVEVSANKLTEVTTQFH